LSINNGIVPDQLKIAKVVLIYKKSDKKLACNYRPISLLSIFDKLLKKIMKSRLYSYLESNNIFFDYQFGFRHNHSTTLALIVAVDKLYENLDKSIRLLVFI